MYIRGRLRRHRRRIAVMAALITLASLVVIHHSPAMGADMGHMDGSIAFCVAVAPMLLLGVIVRRRGVWPLISGPSASFLVPLVSLVPVGSVTPRARAGPPRITVPLRL